MSPVFRPVTSLQRSMLFATRLSPDAGLNFEQILLEFPGPLDGGRLGRAWEILGRRHEALRTRFRWPAGGQPTQEAGETLQVACADGEAADADPSGYEQRLAAYLEADRRAGWRIEEGPPSRWRTFRRPDGGTTLVWSFPHVLLDGRSMTLLLADLVRIERDLGSGREPEDTPRAGSGGYLAWLGEQDWAAAERYWRQVFEGYQAPPRIALGVGTADRSDGGRTREVRAEWEAEWVARLTAFAGSWEGTLNTVLQGAYGLVLSRYLGVSDVAFAVVRAGRHWDGREHGREVGMFMTALPVRCRVPAGRTVRDWLGGLRSQHLAVRPHEHTPIELLNGWMNWPAGVPLVESGYRYERADFTTSLDRVLGGSGGIRVGIRERAGMPLYLSAEGESRLSLTLEYDPARCAPALAERFLGHLRTVCEAMVAAPEAEVHRLPIPAVAGERRQPTALPGWGGGPPDSVVTELSTRARLEGSDGAAAVAVEDGAGRMTYAELDAFAWRLAAVLRARGVRKGDVVALSTGRRAHGVGALLGVLSAGAVVLTLDPSLPAERLRFLVADAGVRFLVGDAASAPALAGLGLAIVRVGESGPEEPAGETVAVPGPGPGPEPEPGPGPGPLDAAYLIYTSGTTGKPKGVLNTHRGLANEARSAAHLFRLGPGDRMLQVSNLGFDAALEEIFATLLAGATLVCRPPDALDSMSAFHRTVSERRITALDLTTALWAQWVSWIDREGQVLPRALRVVVVGGEKTQAGTFATWRQLSRGRVRWVNTYGPTEAAIVATAYVVDDQEPEPRSERGASAPGAGEEVPIGRPLPHVFVRILDAERREVPAGLAGELYIGGVGVAQGYLNRPDLTGRSFIADPLATPAEAAAGARLYRTGDLGRLREDGEIEYLGRADNQVKLRGFRIELDEVETALASHPAVAESVVVPVLEGGRVTALAAYLVPRPGSPAVVAGLKEHLGARLPNYAVPAHFVVLERLPLTANGKVDRRALPKPESREEGEASRGGEPANAVEARLARVFARALRREQVGVEEGFQEAGGDSFMVMELIELAAREGFLLHPETIIRYPTVRRLAAHLTADATRGEAGGAGGANEGPISVLREAPGCPRLFLAHSTPGDVLGYGNLVHALGPGVAVYGFSSLGLTEPDRAHDTIEGMASYYVDWLLETHPGGPYHLAGWCYGGTVAFEMAAQLARRGHEVGVVGLIDAYAHVPNGCLGRWRYRLRRASALFRLGPARWFGFVATRLGWSAAREPDLEVAAGAPSRVANRDLVRGRNLDAYRRYHGEGYRGRVTVYLSTRTAPDAVYDPTGGWTLFSCSAECVPVTADHRDVLKPPAVDEIARHLREAVQGYRRVGG